MPGTPDWQKPTQISDTPLLNESGKSVAAGGSTGITDTAVASWQSVRLTVYFGSGYGTVYLSFRDTPGTTSPVFQRIWTLTQGTYLHVVVPAYGQYTRVTVDNDSAAAASVDVYYALTAIPTAQIIYPRVTDGYYLAETAIAAGTAALLKITDIWDGPAVVSFRPYDSSGDVNATLYTLTGSGGTDNAVAELGAATSDTIYQVALPAQPCELYLYNFGTTSHSVRAAVIRG